MALSSKRPTATRDQVKGQVLAEVRESRSGLGLVRLNVVMPESKRLALKIRSAQDGRTIAEIVNELIDHYLDEAMKL